MESITHSACAIISLEKVVKSFLKNRPIIHYQAEAARIAHFYSAGILTEEGEWVLTEDVEVVSIETVL